MHGAATPTKMLLNTSTEGRAACSAERPWGKHCYNAHMHAIHYTCTYTSCTMCLRQRDRERETERERERERESSVVVHVE